MAVESLLGIPTALFINVEARGAKPLVLFLTRFFLLTPTHHSQSPVSNFALKLADFPSGRGRGWGRGHLVSCSWSRAGRVLGRASVSGSRWGTQPVPEPGQ